MEKKTQIMIFGKDSNEFQNQIKRRKLLLQDGLINSLQLKVLQWVDLQSRILSEEYQNQILPSRFERLGYEPKKIIPIVLHYTERISPLIIHINLNENLIKFLKDTHYRNQFETKSSGGSKVLEKRKMWEDKIFGGKNEKSGIYGDCPSNEKVKYGVLNIVNDPRGINLCSQYGKSYFLMKNSTVRLRTSFASCDSSNYDQVRVASCENYAHVLNEYCEEELRALIEVALGKVTHHDSHKILKYKEVQFHGDIKFDRDIDALVVHEEHKNDTQMFENLKLFTEKNNILLIWMDCKFSKLGLTEMYNEINSAKK